MDKEQRYKDQISGFAETINDFAKAVGDDSLTVEVDETGAISVSDLRHAGTRVVDVLFDSTAVIDMDAAMEHLDAVAYMNGWIDGSNFERDVVLELPNLDDDQPQDNGDGSDEED